MTRNGKNMVRKNAGNKNPRRFIPAEIKAMRKSYSNDDSAKNRDKLAEKYGISVSMLYRIVTRKAYAEVE